jgi:2-methylcitrate dehydratase PrpD
MRSSPAALDTIAGFVAGLSAASPSQDAVARARLAFRDTLGTMVGGTATTAAQIAATVARRDAGPSLLAAGGSASSSMAAFANGVAASALDFDDGHYRGGAIHPASAIVPTLLALSSPDTTFEELLLAHVAGVEVGIRAAHLLWPRHPDDDYHCTGTAGAIGAAAAGAKLCGLDADGIARSIATAWAHAPMSAFQWPMLKESIGWAAATATTAVHLSAAGFMRFPTARRPPPPDVFPPTPFDRVGAMDDPFVDTWASVWETANTYFKPFAACRYTHAAAGGLQTFMRERHLGADDIESIALGTHRSAVFLNDPCPPTLEHAQYSFQFVLAAVALFGAAGAKEMSEANLSNDELLSVARRVTVSYAPELDALYPAHYPATLSITTRDGGTTELLCEIAPGDSEAPLTNDELHSKFVGLVEPGLGHDEAEALARDMENPTGAVADLFARAIAGCR